MRLGTNVTTCRSLSRDNKHTVEKEQVLKLVRTLIEIGTVRRDSPATGGTGVVPLTESVMRALIAVAEQPEDPFRPICIQTLTEICMLLLLSYIGGLVD